VRDEIESQLATYSPVELKKTALPASA
jgi:hypothetical protein